MKFALKNLVVAATFVAVGVASAAPITVTPDDPFWGGRISGSGALSFSAELMGAWDAARVAVTPSGGAIVNITKDSDGFYTSAAVSASISSVTIDDVTRNLLQVATVGGATQTAPVLKSVTSGGVMTVTDLRVDLVAKRVYANIVSNNALNAAGDKTLNNFHLWDVMGKAQYGADASFTGYDASTAIVGSTTMTGEPVLIGNIPTSWFDNHGITLNGLKITADGFDAFSNGLGLLTLGRSALLGVNDFGTLTVGTVPEPSTYALMGLGLFGVSVVARRRQK